jgi:UDP-N-acetylglucosamine--N-acetylmuramyl-(pentapeptide) pyrophosphoryl-undecaprenol N-acetylglucosamine transferase
MLSRLSKKVFLNFEEAASHLSTKVAWQHVGNPVRPGFATLNREEAIQQWELDPSLPTLLVFGGSQGAMSINRAVTDILPGLSERYNLIWSRGHVDKSEPTGWNGPGKLIVRAFIDDMPSACAAADLAVCRSGAMTLSELQAAALPAILVPYPYAAGDHQKHNALTFSAKGGSLMIENKELNGDRLYQEITGLLDRRDRLIEMRQALRELPIQDAATIIAEEILATANQRN